MSASSMQQIEKLGNGNYESWKIQMKSILRLNELWGYVAGEIQKTPENQAACTLKDEKALDLIILSLQKTQYNHIKRTQTSCEAWEALKTVYESKGPMKQFVLYKQLYRMRKDTRQGMAQYIDEFVHKVEQLEESGIKLPDTILPIMLLTSLPSDYETFSIAIESREKMPTLCELKVKLLEEEIRKADADGTKEMDKEEAVFSNKKYTYDKREQKDRYQKPREYNQYKKFTDKCYVCGKTGHMAKYCRNKPRQFSMRNNKEDAMIATALNSSHLASNAWCLDSGATVHMCKERRAFKNLNEKETSKVYTTTESSTSALGKGEVKVNITSNKSIKLTDVLYVPDFRNNLLSVSSITEHGYTITFKKNSAVVKRVDGTIALTAYKQNGLYIVKQRDKQQVMQAIEDDDKLTRWHQRLGHLNFNDVKKLFTDDMVTGATIHQKDMSRAPKCIQCDVSKVHQLPYKESNTREKEVLGLIHTDLCSPMTASLGGARYFATFTDDKTRYVTVVILKEKSEIFNAFKTYKARVEKQTGKQIKKIRSDNAKEYVSKEFSEYLAKEGIERQLSTVYTPQQNGIAERANKTIVEAARTMMTQAELPTNLWAEAVNTAAYIRNRCPTKKLSDMTPYEAWTGEKPNVSYLRIFGSKTIALEKRMKLNKFLPKGKEYILVGYSQESKAYRLWEEGTRSVVVRRDVKFHEKVKNVITSNDDSFIYPSEEETQITPETSEEKQIEEEEEESTSEVESGEDTNNDENLRETTESQRLRRRGRPKLMRTGNRGRPKKVYNQSANMGEETHSEPKNVKEAMNSDDKSL